MSPSHEGELSERLNQLLKYLQTDFYSHLKPLCDKVSILVTETRDLELSRSASLYFSKSQRLIDEVDRFLRLRRIGLLPYIEEIINKEDEGHDCRQCSGPCAISHGARITEIRKSHARIEEAMNRLHLAALPFSESQSGNEGYHQLHTQMKKIDATLTELITLEESSLIPLVMEAQKAIHANN